MSGRDLEVELDKLWLAFADHEARLKDQRKLIDQLLTWAAAGDIVNVTAIGKLYAESAPTSGRERWLGGLSEALQQEIDRNEEAQRATLGGSLALSASELARRRVETLDRVIRSLLKR